ncbi:hypothetical protein ACTFIV_002762 [Dictyostelium citrinum]
MIKSFFNKVYSPKNFDSISIKKTKYNVLIFLILFIIFQFIIVIVSIKDSKNRLTFVESKIENDLKVPHFFINSNISSFSYNILNVENDAIETYLKNGCDFNFLNGNCSCKENQDFKVTNGSGVFYPYYTPSNVITFQKTYIRVVSNYIKIPNPSPVDQKKQKMAGIAFYDDLDLIVSPPAKVQFLLKKEVYIDRYGTEKVHLSPVLITSPFPLPVCNNLTSGEPIFDCFTIDISILYQTNIVLYYTEETDRQLITRILADISSVSRLILYLLYITISFIITRFLFNQKTAWFPNSIRDGILYHFKYYRVQKNLTQVTKETPSIISKIFRKLKNIGKNENDIDLFEERNQYEKLKDEAYKIKKATEGSKIKLKRIFQSIDPQDEDSYNLSKVSKFKLFIFIILMIIISAIIIFKNASNRMAITQFENQQLLDLPKLNFSFIGNNINWIKSTEILPNGESKICSYQFNNCQSPNDFPNNTIIDYHSAIVNSDSIFMKENEIFQFHVDFSIILFDQEILDLNNIIIKLTLNEIDHLITPFSNVTVLLEKTIFHKFDGTNETMYDTNLIVTFVPYSSYYNETSFIATYIGKSFLNIQYSENQVRHIYEETDFQLGKRLLKYIMAFSSPLSIIIGLIFTYIVIRFLFKTPSAHCDPTVREPIIFFLNYYRKYPEIFKNK